MLIYVCNPSWEILGDRVEHRLIILDYAIMAAMLEFTMNFFILFN